MKKSKRTIPVDRVMPRKGTPVPENQRKKERRMNSGSELPKTQHIMRKNGMITLLSLTLLLCPLLSNSLQAFPSAETVAFLPWGNGEAHLGKVENYDGVYGPSSFYVQANGDLLVLDSINGVVKQIKEKNQRVTTLFKIAPYARDIVVNGKDEVTVLYHDRIEKYTLNGGLLEQVKLLSRFRFISGLGLGEQGDTFITLARGDSLEVAKLAYKSEVEALKTGLPSKSAMFQVERVDDYYGRVFRYTKRGILEKTIDFVIDEGNVATIRFIGIDSQQLIYLAVETFISQSPIQVSRMVVIIDEQGNRINTISLPPSVASYAMHDLRLASDDTLWYMLRTHKGVYFIRWSSDPVHSSSKSPIPMEAYQEYHYNELLTPHALDRGTEAKSNENYYESSLTRSEALAIADSYVQHTWYASSCNIGSTYCGGKTVTTPSWVTTGSKQRVVYKWGGFSSISEFDSGLSSCKYAGDKNTTGGGSSCAVGVDCSGFVSRCWKTSTKYGTSTLPNISYVIGINEMKAGDIFNKAGSHVRMFVSQNPNGTYNLVESFAGSNYWRVDYTVRTASDNSSYTPRRCNWITDDYDPSRPGTMENPIVIGSLPYTDNNTTVDGPSDFFDYYSCAPSTNESGPELFYKLTLTSAATLTVTVSDGYGVDIDVHLLSSLSENSCIARHNTSFTVGGLSAGTYYITADTWVNSSGYEYTGPYTLTVQKQ